MNTKKIPDNLLIKAVGNWNPRIFTPQWISNNLTKGEHPLKIAFLFNPAKGDAGYEIDGIMLFPTVNDLQIAIQNKGKITEENIILITKFIIKILELLPHTPITAIGFNVNYLLDTKQESKIINWLKSQNSIFEDLTLKQITISNKFDNFTKNIIIAPDNEGVTISFNYHYDKWDIFEPNHYLELIEDSARYF